MRIVIPARMSSTRLPNKPLAMIGDKPMIQHVWERAVSTGFPVTIATDDPIVKQTLPDAEVMLTTDAPTGSDRVALILEQYDDDVIINCQGDIPFIEPEQILASALALDYAGVGTLVHEMETEKMNDPSAVKAICSGDGMFLQCHWFCRASLSYGYHHVGVYAYRRGVLEAFSKHPQTEHEQIEKLEQLRLIEMGQPIVAVKTNPVPTEVNTEQDLEQARRINETRQGLGTD